VRVCPLYRSLSIGSKPGQPHRGSFEYGFIFQKPRPGSKHGLLQGEADGLTTQCGSRIDVPPCLVLNIHGGGAIPAFGDI
jgi:hypothetical protein